MTITAGTGRPAVTPVPKSRIRMMATILGITLAVAPAPWAFKTYDSARDDNATKPVGTHEGLELLPGLAMSTREGEEQPAAQTGPDGLSLDLGEMQAGSSRSYEDLIRLHNTGDNPLLVFVEPQKLSQSPMHASVSGDQAPGVYWVRPGEIRSVDVGVAADLIAPQGDVDGEFVVRTASGLVRYSVPALLTITAPSEESVMAALLAAAGVANPETGGFGKVGGDPAAGMEKVDFEVDGVWDGGIYTTDVTVTWRPVGPLADARAFLNDKLIGNSVVVGSERDHVLRMEAWIMGSVHFQREVRFRVDRSPPETHLDAPGITFGNPASFSVTATDASPIAGVEVVLRKRGSENSSSPSPSPTPKPSSSPSPTPKPSSSPSPTPKPSSSPSPTPTPTPTPAPSNSPDPDEDEDLIRVTATWDEESGTYIARVQLDKGVYDVWAVAVDVVGHEAETEPQTTEVIGAPLPLLGR